MLIAFIINLAAGFLKTSLYPQNKAGRVFLTDKKMLKYNKINLKNYGEKIPRFNLSAGYFITGGFFPFLAVG